MEDTMTIDRMERVMQEYTHPDAWRCVAGGSWSRPDNRSMPMALRHRLDAVAAATKR